MTGKTLRGIRDGLAMSQSAFGLALGYEGGNVSRHIRAFESDKREIPPAVSRLALMFAWHGVPDDWRGQK